MPVKRLTRAALLMAALGLSACATAGGVATDDGIRDPFERRNRNIHEFNRGLDRAVVGPAGRGFSAVLPDVVEDGLSNFATNVSMPSVVVNGFLQGDLEVTGLALSRLFVNTLFGFGGILDAATAFQIPEAEADFGETLYVWGFAEGPYVELPIFGPSTRRHTVGRVVDLFTNPLSYVFGSPGRFVAPVSNVGERLSDRGRFTDTVDSILYDSADSYAQLRLIYLQSRRFELGQEDPEQEIDPFALETEGF